jgi:hypothetical protein
MSDSAPGDRRPAVADLGRSASRARAVRTPRPTHGATAFRSHPCRHACRACISRLARQHRRHRSRPMHRGCCVQGQLRRYPLIRLTVANENRPAGRFSFVGSERGQAPTSRRGVARASRTVIRTGNRYRSAQLWTASHSNGSRRTAYRRSDSRLWVDSSYSPQRRVYGSLPSNSGRTS